LLSASMSTPSKKVTSSTGVACVAVTIIWRAGARSI